ncbi:MAG: DNA polymerase III [Candidatus Yanofskybacteria bacterium RIFOXYD1_FULL_42_10]|uniref:DNA-directed DNA polymerase n=2 Tax=Candidatus Yanofskyibacteriota TaxID=1752733 RepID=A0A1F8HV58_9BACT|nr:MAG: DNA polymerase III [Candidatus Yanofskybacteria bacterium RIFCSPLOWO2_01_FULL_41_33]OGN41467.1 MAG: DNA polymerase III [Candidatus Yanofskybacteria bacterium RIFOXYD1_FULL_42_10]
MMNQELVKILREISVLLEIKGVEFKPQAYEKVAHSIEMLEEDVKEIYKKGGIEALEKISGVGRGIAEKIEEYIKEHRIKDYLSLKKELPVDIDGLSVVEGVGPKMILKLYEELKIKTRDQLEKAARAGKLKSIEGFGQKTEENILRSIDFLKKEHGRFILGFVMPEVRAIVEKIKKVDGVEKAEFAGSIRRMQETVGDLDILVISKKPSAVMDFFVSMSEVEAVYAKGDTKSSIRLKLGMDADLRVLPPESFGAALQYFTGDKYHNIELRQIAIKQGYKLNEYGLYKDKKIMAGQTEEEIYQKLGFAWMPPELRANRGELEAARENKLPKLIEYSDLVGDLQVQTDWTDGDNSIKEMAEAAQKIGLKYICITDHTKTLAMTGGSDEKKLLRQMAAIDEVNREFQGPGFKVLKGAEVNIMKDGTLDIDDETLAKLDVAGVSVHSNFNMSEKDMTARIIRAMENPNVDILFHPTGRVIKRREAYKVDMDELLKTAKRTKTVMEIDAFPDRLDLKDEYIRKAVETGVKLAIDSDAHSASHFQYLEYGIAQARRGWAEKKDIINTKDLEDMLKLLK